MADLMDRNAPQTIRTSGKTQRLMAPAMVAAWRAPTFGVVIKVDRQAALAKRGTAETVADVIVQACVETPLL